MKNNYNQINSSSNIMQKFDSKLSENFGCSKSRWDCIVKVLKAYNSVISLCLNQENAVDNNWLQQIFSYNSTYQEIKCWKEILGTTPQDNLNYQDFREFDNNYFQFIKYHENDMKKKFFSSIFSKALSHYLDKNTDYVLKGISQHAATDFLMSNRAGNFQYNNVFIKLKTKIQHTGNKLAIADTIKGTCEYLFDEAVGVKYNKFFNSYGNVGVVYKEENSYVDKSFVLQIIQRDFPVEPYDYNDELYKSEYNRSYTHYFNRSSSGFSSNTIVNSCNSIFKSSENSNITVEWTNSDVVTEISHDDLKCYEILDLKLLSDFSLA